MSVEYRVLTAEDMEQSAYVEAVAFYNRPSPALSDMMQQVLSPEWTVGAFVDGKLVADVRTIPQVRRINGAGIGFGAVGPVACLAAYRRQGHVAQLLRFALERMRDAGQALSGLYTPHDALYARYGWERAEGRKHYELRAKDVRLRLQGRRGRIEEAPADGWQRLDAIYREHSKPRNGPFQRVEAWWRFAVLQHWSEEQTLEPSDAVVWVSPEGRDEGYAVYHAITLGMEGRWPARQVYVRDFVSLSGDAYLGLWQHLLAHDVAKSVAIDVPLEDQFPAVVEDPWKVDVQRGEGAMLRVVDLERAISKRPYAGQRAARFTMRISDTAAPWNDGTWRIEAAEGRLTAERTDGQADVELTANTLAPLFTGHMRPDVAAGVGLLKVNRPEAIAEMAEAFSVTHPPFSHDTY